MMIWNCIWLWNKKSKKLIGWWIEWAQDVLNYTTAPDSIPERVLSSLSGARCYSLGRTWGRVLLRVSNAFFFLDADNLFIVLQHVWVVTCDFNVLITVYNNILDLVFLRKKILSKNNIGCALFEDLSRMRYPNYLMIPYNHIDEGYHIVRKSI